MRKLMTAIFLIAALPALVRAQAKPHTYRGEGYLYFGLGRGFAWYYQRTIEQIGGGGELYLWKGLAAGTEVGYAHWGPQDNQAFVGSGDISYHFRRGARRGTADPFILIGITGFFPTSNGRGAPAGNFGGGVNLWLREHTALRLGFRDTVNPQSRFSSAIAYPGTHYVSFRFGVTFR